MSGSVAFGARRHHKCFGNSNARSSLKRDVIYTDAAQRDTFNYWRNLRNKKIVHDENDVTQFARPSGTPAARIRAEN